MTKRDKRQFDYRERSILARSYARVLMPVFMLSVGASVWSDPVMRPQLEQGLEEIRPIAASFLADTPLEDILSPAPAEQTPDQPAETDERLADASELPDSSLPVNRP